jgi:glycosyltransferase involved in cell wall biosynthesis
MVTQVLLDASCLDDANSTTRGFGRYVRALLDSVPDEVDIKLIALAGPDVPLPLGVERLPVKRSAPQRLAFSEHMLRLGRDAARSGAGLLHQPTAEPPWRSPIPYVQTLHDVIPLIFDDPGFQFERRRWRYRGRAMRRADRVIAITQWSADLGVTHLGLDPGRIRVIHHGVNPTFGPPLSYREPATPYLLYVGEYGPHKGFAEACAAVQQLAEHGYSHELRIVGNVNAYARPHVDRLLAQVPRAVHLGRISDEELAEQYRSATALVFTSRCEGFGRPPIEAMATGTPVVAFANTSIPEVIGTGGALVADGDVAAVVDALRLIIDSPDRRAELSAAALARATTAFSWTRCARETAEVYRELAERG